MKLTKPIYVRQQREGKSAVGLQVVGSASNCVCLAALSSLNAVNFRVMFRYRDLSSVSPRLPYAKQLVVVNGYACTDGVFRLNRSAKKSGKS